MKSADIIRSAKFYYFTLACYFAGFYWYALLDKMSG